MQNAGGYCVKGLLCRTTFSSFLPSCGPASAAKCHSTLQRPGLYWGVRKDDKILAVSFEDHSSLHFPGTRNVAHTKDSARSRRVWLNTPDSNATRCGFFWSVVWRRARVSSKLQEFATSILNSVGVSPASYQQIIVKSKLLIPHLTKLIQIGKSKLPSCCGFPSTCPFFEPRNWGQPLDRLSAVSRFGLLRLVVISHIQYLQDWWIQTVREKQKRETNGKNNRNDDNQIRVAVMNMSNPKICFWWEFDLFKAWISMGSTPTWIWWNFTKSSKMIPCFHGRWSHASMLCSWGPYSSHGKKW